MTRVIDTTLQLGASHAPPERCLTAFEQYARATLGDLRHLTDERRRDLEHKWTQLADAEKQVWIDLI